MKPREAPLNVYKKHSTQPREEQDRQRQRKNPIEEDNEPRHTPSREATKQNTAHERKRRNSQKARKEKEEKRIEKDNAHGISGQRSRKDPEKRANKPTEATDSKELRSE